MDLSSNKIGDLGGCDLAAMLQYNQSLQFLSLKNNSMQEQTGEVLTNFLKANTTLLDLDVTFNDFNYKHISQIERKIKENMKMYKAAAIDRYKKGKKENPENIL